jgi:catechol 2,3-dioxygenase-like lactoylglutathione lyase family enzyme
MPDRPAQQNRFLASLGMTSLRIFPSYNLSSRAKRGNCFFFALVFPFVAISVSAQAPPERPRILGISQVEFYSTNKNAAGAFFSAVLDSECLTKAPCSWGNVAQVKGEFNFHKLYGGQNLRLVTSPEPTPSNLLREVAFSTDNVNILKKYLQAKKVAITRASDQDLGITDPEGHEIGFFQSSSLETPAPSNNLRIIHAGFVVRDRAAMEHFYKDILGFRPYWHGGMKDNETAWLDLQVPDGTDWIEFMLNVPADADKKLLGVMNHIALGVPDIHAAQKQLLTNGMKLTEEPQVGRDGKWQLNLYDPDNTRVELMEFTPVEKPCCSSYTGPHPKP